MKEFELINFIKKNIKINNKNIIKGIGDDCAILNYNKTHYLLLTTDSLFEDVHFKKKFFNAKYIGKKSALVNISDILAMGGTPFAALVNIGFKKNEKIEFIKDILKSLIDCFERYKIKIIGGDTISASKIFISISLLGIVNKKHIMLRSGAENDDLIFTTGNLGNSFAGFKLLYFYKHQKYLPYEKKLISQHLTPYLRYKESQLLSNSGFVTSCMDISDGLISDISRITEENKVGAEIFVDDLPISNDVKKVAEKFNDSYYDYALYGGEDYELLFTIKNKDEKNFYKFIKRHNIKVYKIGRIIKEKTIYKIINNKKIKEDFKKVWKHF